MADNCKDDTAAVARKLGVPVRPGEKVVGGRWDNPNRRASGFDLKPTADGSGWNVYITNPQKSVGAEGEMYARCLK